MMVMVIMYGCDFRGQHWYFSFIQAYEPYTSESFVCKHTQNASVMKSSCMHVVALAVNLEAYRQAW